MLGIIIGVMSVILVVTIGQGGQARILNEMESFGTNLFAIFLGAVEDGDYDRYRFTLEDCRAIRDSVDSIKALVPIAYGYSTVESLRKKESATVYGTDGGYAEVRNVKLVQGRFFSSIDNAVGRRVMVINQKLAEDMFGSSQEAVGKKLKIKKLSVMVCGVSEPGSGMFGPERPAAYIPIKLHFRLFNSEGYIGEIHGTAISKDLVDDAAKKAIRILEVRHRTKEPKIYQYVTMAQEMEVANKVTGIITMIIGAIAGISLLVGGIGIMNIMMVSVTERTREIGIRMALGARKEDILLQFLIESVVLSVAGGLIGMFLGIGISVIVCSAMKVPLIISLWTVFFAILFSAAVGVFFGLYPANRAAKQDPIEALRYE